MTKEVLTPCEALFDMMKRYGRIKNKELASLILSGRPLFDGVSPVSRINDKTWLSRFVVHAPIGSLQENYFADYSTSALRVVSRLKAHGRTSFTDQQILDMICGEEGGEMIQALIRTHQDVSVYENVLQRLSCESGFTVNERAEMAMILLITAGCSANVRKAAAQVVEFAKQVHGAGMATPLITPKSIPYAARAHDNTSASAPTIALMRLVDGFLSGNPYWLDPNGEGIEIGSLALGEGAITDVDADVSGHHLLIQHAEDGIWYAKGLRSTHGTVLISGVDHAEVVVEAPREQRDINSDAGACVPIHPGDELVLASHTRFVVLEGIPKR